MYTSITTKIMHVSVGPKVSLEGAHCGELGVGFQTGKCKGPGAGTSVVAPERAEEASGDCDRGRSRGEKPHRGAFLAESKHFPGTLLTGE